MIAARNTKRSRKRPASRTPVRRGPSGATRHEGGSHYVSKSYSEGGSFTQGGQSVTANFHAHDHNVNTDDGSESRPVAGGGGSNSDSGDSSDVTDDANDGNYSSVSGSLTQTGTATDDEKQTDKGQQGQSTSFAGTSSSGSQQVSGGGSDDDHAHETGGYTDVNGKLTAEDMNYTDDDITKQFNNRTDSASGLYLTSGTMTSGDSMGNSASQSYHDSGETIVSAGGADTSDKGGSHTTASASASYSFSGTFDNGGGTSGTQTLKENELDTKDDGAANYDIENGTDVSEHDTFNDAEHGDSSSVNTLKQTFGGVSSSQSYSSGGHSDVTDNGGDDWASNQMTDETDNFTDDSHSEDTSNYVTSAGGGAVANAANGVWGDWGNMPSLVQASYLWGSQVGLGDSALTYPGLAPNAVSSTANSNTDATFKHHDDGEYSLTSGTSGTSENFNDTNTYNDNASQWISAVGNYSYAGDETDTTQITQNSAVDNETDIDGGTIDAGVTNEHYKNTGGETDIASTSGTTIGTYTSGGGSASGTSFEEEISSFTETGSYATLPSTSSTGGTGSSTTGSGGTSAGGTGTTSGGGYASSSQHIVYDDNVTETLTDNGNGLESGPGVSVTGIGTYFGTASQSVHSDSTHTTDASAGTDTTTGNYSVSFSDNNNYSYNENGQVVVPQTQSETWSHASSYIGKDKDTESGDYSNPTGTETLSSGGASSMSETVTWTDWSSDGSGGGHWETPPNTSWNGYTQASGMSSGGGGAYKDDAPGNVTTSNPATPPVQTGGAPAATTPRINPNNPFLLHNANTSGGPGPYSYAVPAAPKGVVPPRGVELAKPAPWDPREALWDALISGAQARGMPTRLLENLRDKGYALQGGDRHTPKVGGGRVILPESDFKDIKSGIITTAVLSAIYNEAVGAFFMENVAPWMKEILEAEGYTGTKFWHTGSEMADEAISELAARVVAVVGKATNLSRAIFAGADTPSHGEPGEKFDTAPRHGPPGARGSDDQGDCTVTQVPINTFSR